MGLSIKLHSKYIYNGKLHELVAITSTNLGGWLRLRELETGKEFVMHRKQEYLLELA